MTVDGWYQGIPVIGTPGRFLPPLVAHLPDLTVGEDDFAAAARHYHAVPEPWIQPDEVADLVLYLGSDESRSVTAENIRIDLGVVVKGLPSR